VVLITFGVMKIRSILLLYILLSLTSYSQESKHQSCSNFKSALFYNKSATLPPNQIAHTEKYDVKFYKLDLNVTHLSTAISGIVEMQANARTGIDTIVYELFPDLVISQIKLNGSVVPFFRNQSAVKVPANLGSGTTFTVTTTYSGNPPTAATNPLGGAGLTNASSPTWGNQVTWSLSEPFSAYEWWPCKQSLRDKIDSVDVNITVPTICKAGSNGILKNIINLGNGNTRYEWKHRRPIVHYLISVAVAKYLEYNVFAHPAGFSDSILIQNYIYDNPATLTTFKADIDETADFLEYFSTIYGPYPFRSEKYGHCMAPIGGGMEHQTMTTQGSFSKTLTAHELSHQWFGDHVTCGSWADIWVNEGFATYSEYLMLSKLYPNESLAEMAGNHSLVLQETDGAVWVEDSLNAGRIFSGRLTYAKGAAIIHTFRYIMNNDSAFFRALKKYQIRFADSTAIGTDVQKVFEEESGMDLSAAFEQWYFGEGHPTYSASWNTIGSNLHLRISQTASAPLVTPTFTNPLEITFRRTGLADTTIRFSISANSNNFVIPEMGNVISIQAIDQKNWIVNRIGTTSKDPNLVITSNESPIAKTEWKIFPNPAKGHIQISAPESGIFIVKVLDPKGKFLFSKQFQDETEIDITNYQSGIYLLQIESQTGGRKILRLIRK